MLWKNLKKSKSAGLDGLSSEHFIYADVSINKLLLMLFNSIIVHGFIPNELMNTMIIPLVKDKKGDVTSKDNYRPIAVTNISS